MMHEPAQRDRRPFLLIPLAALVAILPLLVHGCSCGHDFDFHLVSWFEAADQFSHGNLYPHWAYTPAFNAGEPRFVFYPPISWVLGAVLGLILTHLPGVSETAGWTAAPIVFTWIALTVSGFAMHRLARAFAGPTAALLAAMLYVANPYMLFTAYERTAYGELLAAAWMPLLMLAILRARVTVAGIAVPLALLWLTNAPAAVIGSYTLAVLAAIRVITGFRMGAAPGVAELEGWVSRHRETLQFALRTVAGTALGLGLATFYILPAAYERRYVQIALAIIEGGYIYENTLFHHTGMTADDIAHDEVLHTASLLAVVLLVATAVALVAAFVVRRRSQRLKGSLDAGERDGSVDGSGAAFPMLSLGFLVAAIGFLLTPWSLGIWNHAPEAAFLQFPWRLLMVVAVSLALAVASALERLQFSGAGTAIAGIALAAALTFPVYHVFRQGCDPEDTARDRLALFHSGAGTDDTEEYTPVNADNDALKPNHPPYWLADSPGAAPRVNARLGPAPSHFTVTASHAEDLILSLREYPAWRVSINGAIDARRLARPDGLIVLPVSAGDSTVDIRYGRLPDQTASDVISLLAIVLLFSFCIHSRRAHR